MPMGSTLGASIQTDTTHYVEYALNRKRLALAEDIIMKYAWVLAEASCNPATPAYYITWSDNGD